MDFQALASSVGDHAEKLLRRAAWWWTGLRPSTKLAVCLGVLAWAGRYQLRRLQTVRIRESLVVITGASRGIGRALARKMLEEGARVVMLARNEDVLREAWNLLEQDFPGRASYWAVDCSDYAAVSTVARQVCDRFGAPALLINCAGLGAFRFVWEHETEEEMRRYFDAPLFASIFTTKAFLPAMAQLPSKRFLGVVPIPAAQVINIQTPAGLAFFRGATLYTSCRHALHGFSTALSADLAGTRVKVQEIVLGEVSSSYWSANPQSRERLPLLAQLIPSLSEERAARCVIAGIRSGAPQAIYPLTIHCLVWTHWLSPSFIEWILTMTSPGEANPEGPQ